MPSKPPPRGERPERAPAPRFLNVDLDVEAGGDLSPLLEHWKGPMVTLVEPSDTGGNFARLEHSTQPTDAADAIRRFCDAIETLPPDLAEFWLHCPVRQLVIGYESGHEPPYYQETLSADLLARAARCFTGIGTIVYPVQ
ncbi:MAG: hypothetical protein JNL02_02275 [Saprospiraceae bacterium]|nr:hypothetical protein [Saprospiraceae bacterium]